MISKPKSFKEKYAQIAAKDGIVALTVKFSENFISVGDDSWFIQLQKLCNVLIASNESFINGIIGYYTVFAAKREIIKPELTTTTQTFEVMAVVWLTGHKIHKSINRLILGCKKSQHQKRA